MTSILYTVRMAENIKRRTPKTIPVKLIAKGRERAPAPSVALQRLDMEPVCNRSHRRLNVILLAGGIAGVESDPTSVPTDEESELSLSSVLSMFMCSPLGDMEFACSRGDMEFERLSEWSIIQSFQISDAHGTEPLTLFPSLSALSARVYYFVETSFFAPPMRLRT
jgi:hypothetical protein